MNEFKLYIKYTLIYTLCVFLALPAKSQILSKIDYKLAIERYKRDTLLNKIDWNIYEIITYANEHVQKGVPVFQDSLKTLVSSSLIQFDKEGRILCYLWLNEVYPKQFLKDRLNSYEGVKVKSFMEDYRYVLAYISINEFQNLLLIKELKQISAVPKGNTDYGTIQSEGLSILRVDLVHDKFNINGDNVKIGVISDGVVPDGQPVMHSVRLDIAGYELPPFIQRYDQLSQDGPQLLVINNSYVDNTAEGTAMLEIVHDLAPNSDLLFYTAWPDDGPFLSEAVQTLSNLGCNVIVDDAYEWDQPYFIDSAGVSAKPYHEIKSFVNNGGIYITSAGNQAQKHFSEQFIDSDGDSYLNFSNADNSFDFQLNNETDIEFHCQWSDTWDNSTTSISLEIWENNGGTNDNLVAQNLSQSGQIPYVSISYHKTGTGYKDYYLKIKNNGTGGNFRIKFFLNGEPGEYYIADNQYISSCGSLIGHHFFENAISSAAISGQPNDPENNTYDVVEAYSSVGPVRIYTDFQNQIFVERNKPDLTAIDNVSVSGAFGFVSPFTGTSTSAPHIAAIAGLIKSASSNLTKEQISTIIYNTCIKVGSYSYGTETNMSNETGFGRVDAYNALRIGRNENEPYSYTQSFIDCYVNGEVKAASHNPGPPSEDVNIDWYGSEFSKQKFQNGGIFFHKGQPDAFWLGEGIWNKWLELNGPASNLGLPLSNEIEDTCNNNYPTVYFDHGKIYWNGTEAVACPFLTYFTAEITEGSIPLTVQFTDTSLVQNASISNWLWDFGDGHFSTEQNPIHIFSLSGYFTVSLTIYDHDFGFANIKTNYINTSSNEVITDVDGNSYNTVFIGNQCWMAENLNTTKDAAGNTITRFCYDNDATNCGLYGGLYQWTTVMNGAASSNGNPSGVLGICPTGWHVPSDAEWTQLVDYVVAQGFPNTNDGSAGKALRSCRQINSPFSDSCNTTEHPRWDTYSDYGFDEFGFSAFPTGIRTNNGSYNSFGSQGFWWSSTETSNPVSAFIRTLSSGSSMITSGSLLKGNGVGVRCIKDENNTSASIGGKIFDDLNNNGIFDSLDYPLSTGWVVNLNGPINQNLTPDSDGNYTFSNLTPGEYTVSESVPSNWTVDSPFWGGTYTIQLQNGDNIIDKDFANFYLLRSDSSIEYLYFPNGQNTGDNEAIPMSPDAPQQSSPISESDLPPNSYHLSVFSDGWTPDTIYVVKNQIVQLAVTSTDAFTHVFMFNDTRLSAVAIGVSPFETRMITFKTYNVNPGEVIEFHCDVPGHAERGEVGYMIIQSDSVPQLNLIYPSESEVIISDQIEFTWSLIENIVNYKLFVDNNSGFGSPEISDQNIPTLQNLTANSFTISGNWLPENVYYWKVLAIRSTDTIASAIRTFTYSPPKLPNPNWVPLYRAFLPSETDHFYCSSQPHLNAAIDGNYRFEGVEGYISLHPFEVSSPDTLKNIYRFYIPDTTNSTPKVKGHYYTCSDTDRDNRIIQGWIYEGITGYGFNNEKAGLVPLYHTWLNTPNVSNDNFYTVSEVEKNNSISLFNYIDRGIICYVSPVDSSSQIAYNQNNIDLGLGINPQNGNFSNLSSPSISITEGKVSLNYQHIYNSLAVRYFSNVNPLGNGWSHSYNATLLTTDSLVIVVWPGEVHFYSLQTLDCQTPGVYDKLLQPNAEEFTITKKDQTVYRFSKILTSPLTNTYMLSAITDRNSNQITLGYNNNGRLKWAKTPENKYITFTYYPETDTLKNGLIHYVKDSLALNRVFEYQYDTDRNLTGFIDAMGQNTNFTYDTVSRFDHFLVSITYPDGTVVTNTYNPASKKLTSQSTISGAPETSVQLTTPSANQVSVTDELGKSINMQFNEMGNITQLMSATGNATFEYNNSNNPTKPTTIVDGMGFVTQITYDENGNPLNISKPTGAVYQYQWNTTNDLTLYTNPLNKQTYYSYTDGNLTSVQTPRGSVTMTYSPTGNLLTYTDALGHIQQLTYNASNNLQTASDALGNETTFNYDLAGRKTSMTDANGNVTSYAYYNNDLLLSATDALGKVTQYSYDLNGKLTGVTDANNHATTMLYNDSTGYLQQVIDQIGNNTNYQYEDNGVLKSILNRNSQTITNSYDSSNRLINVSGPTINNTYTYNDNDLPTQISDINGTLGFAYDSLNRLTSYSYTDNYANLVQYDYDLANNLIKITYPGNHDVVYTYDDDNLLHSVTDWLNHVTTYTYRNDGSLSRVDLPNGTYMIYTYDMAGRLTGLENKKSDGSVICSYSYTLDSLGNHTSEQMTQPLEMPELQSSGISYAYNNANRILQAGTTQFIHDLNGNLTNSNNPEANVNFSYNEENRLMTVSGTFNASYTYDALGNRRAAIRDGIETRYVLDISGSMDNVLMECNSSNAPIYYYIYGNGLLYRIKASDNSAQYYHYDSRGSTIAITNAGQEITHEYVYDDFGQILNHLETDFNPFCYVGQYGVMFEDSLLYFMRARYYRPDIGRFLSEDPVWDVNLYSYAKNNSVNRIDPVGRKDQGVIINTKQSFDQYGNQMITTFRQLPNGTVVISDKYTNSVDKWRVIGVLSITLTNEIYEYTTGLVKKVSMNKIESFMQNNVDCLKGEIPNEMIELKMFAGFITFGNLIFGAKTATSE